MRTHLAIRSAAALLVFSLLSSTLAGCSRDKPERPVANTEQSDPEPVVTTNRVGDVETAPRIPAPDAGIQSNAIGELSDEPVPDADETAGIDQQTLDDASASGMTSRTTRGNIQTTSGPEDVVKEN